MWRERLNSDAGDYGVSGQGNLAGVEIAAVAGARAVSFAQLETAAVGGAVSDA